MRTLPKPVLESYLSPKLDVLSLARMRKVCRDFHTLFGKHLLARLTPLLLAIVHRRTNDIKRLVQNDPYLLCLEDEVVDYSFRQFKKASALKCAWWAGDWRTVKLLLSLFPEDQREEAIRQIQIMQSEGIEYHDLESQEIKRESLYNFDQVISDLKTYWTNIGRVWSEFSDEGIEARRKYWSSVVAKNYRKMSVCIANEFCHPTRPFYPTPVFDEEDLPESLLLDRATENSSPPRRPQNLCGEDWFEFYPDNRVLNPSEELLYWFPLTPQKGLGYDFGIHRIAEDFAKTSELGPGGIGGAQWEIAALESMKKTITEKLNLLAKDYINDRPFEKKPTK